MPARRTHYTTDHDTIREWAEGRGGEPAAVKRTRGGRGKGDPGIIRLDFPGYSGEGSLEHISWNDFFRKFDDNNLVFVYQDRTARGQQSNFNKLISAESVNTDAIGNDQNDRPRSSGRSTKAGRTTAARSRGSANSGSGSTSRRPSGSAGRGRSSAAQASRRSGSKSGARRASQSSRSSPRTGAASGSRAGGRSKAASRAR